MAQKKARTPTPPRKVQAPQRRNDSRKDDMGMEHRKWLYAVSAAGIVALVAVIAFIALGGGKNDSAAKEKQLAALFTTAGCSFKTVTAYLPKGQAMHKPSLTATFPWNTDPPSNGQHYPDWAVWGFYTQAVNPRMVVHNEEHGGVIEWWGTKVPQSTIAKLRDFYNEQPDGGFGTPYAKLGTKIALTAWTGDEYKYQQNGYYGQGHIAICPNYTAATEKAYTAFRALYRGHGPEGIPLSADEPGDGPSS